MFEVSTTIHHCCNHSRCLIDFFCFQSICVGQHGERLSSVATHGGEFVFLCFIPCIISWKLTEDKQQRVVKMESLIKDVDIVAWTHLTDLSGNTDDGKDPIKDPEFNQKVRNILLDALMDPENNKMARDMREYYQSPRFNLEAYNAFVKEMDDPKLTIKPNLKWAALSIDQQVGVGLWMVSLKLIKVN